MRPDVRRPVHYAAGSDFIQHKSGQRLDRTGALECIAYHEGVIADRSADPSRHRNSREMVKQIRLAMAATWPEQQEQVA